MAINFLNIEDVCFFHDELIKKYGGSSGLRDKNLLLSAIAQPQITYDGVYLHASIFDMASAYIYHIVNNHPFIDGNKRVGATSLIVFLKINGYEFKISNQELVDTTIKVATGKISKAELSLLIHKIFYKNS